MTPRRPQHNIFQFFNAALSNSLYLGSIALLHFSLAVVIVAALNKTAPVVAVARSKTPQPPAAQHFSIFQKRHCLALLTPDLLHFSVFLELLWLLLHLITLPPRSASRSGGGHVVVYGPMLQSYV